MVLPIKQYIDKLSPSQTKASESAFRKHAYLFRQVSCVHVSVIKTNNDK